MPSSADHVVLSLLIPVYNEVENIALLSEEVTRVLTASGLPWECVWIDDGSGDGTGAALRGLAPPHRILHLQGNAGQSAALMVGARHAHGGWLGIIDGDGQNDPADLVRQYRLALEAGVDLVIGYRALRLDNWLRRLSSRIGNATRSLVVGRTGRDAGCATKVIRRDLMLELPFFHGMQCYIADLVRAAGHPYREIAVNHRSRHAGRAKYGVTNRLWSGVLDLIGVRWLLSRQRRLRTSGPGMPIAGEPPAAP